VVLSTVRDGTSVQETCQEHHITAATFHQWRETALHAATRALAAPLDNTGAAAPRSHLNSGSPPTDPEKGKPRRA